MEHKHGRTTEGMKSLAPGEESVLRTFSLHDTTTAKRTNQLGARLIQAKKDRAYVGGSQMDRDRMPAKWEPRQDASPEMSGGAAAAIWALDECMSLMRINWGSDMCFS
jgi:hypothetical protein